MERITMFRTSCGSTFKTEKEARKHCENRMGAIVTLCAGQLAQIDKYSAACDFVEKHLADFSEAYRWQQEALESLQYFEE